MTSITSEEWLAEIERVASEHPDRCNCLTVREICDTTGMTIEKCRDVLRGLIGSGRWECVWDYRNSIDGTRHRVPAYRPTRKDT